MGSTTSSSSPLVAELLSNAIQVIDNTNFDVAAASFDIRTELKQRWNDLIVVTSTGTATAARVSAPLSYDDCDDDDDSGNDDDDWFRKIYDKHNESGRYYHTPVHLWEMFALLEIVLPQLARQQQQQQQQTMTATSTSTQEDKKDEESSFDDIQSVSTTTSAVAAEIADKMDGNKKKNSTHRCRYCRYYIPIAWAILFHDAVYDPKSNRNEQESATLFLDFSEKNKEMMKRNFNSNRADNQNDDDDDYDNDNETKNNNKNKNNKERTHRLTLDTVVSTLIVATEKHQVIIPTTAATTKNDNNSNKTGDVNTIGSNTDDAYLYYYTIEELVLLQQFFLDIDMAVLGKRKHAYLHYAGLIRNEYSFVPKMVYCTERAKILESFFLLSKYNKNKSNTGEIKYVYLTNTFREAFEERARENLKEEIQLLRRKIIPGEVEKEKD